jgi:hypothetical protein
VSATNQFIAVPLHRHEVSLDYTRVELQLQYTISSVWDIMLRVPWEHKAQDAEIGLVDPATPEQHAAMLRNMNLHHRAESYQGLSDLMLLGRRRLHDVARAGDALTVGLGFTAPAGRTEENPYALGDLGIPHLHIQFGTGTVDPLLEVSYFTTITGSLSSSTYLAGRFPLYENRHTFHAPLDISGGLGAAYRLHSGIWLRAEVGTYYQGYGRWAGLRDDNTGLVATSATIGASRSWQGTTLNVDFRVPLSQRTLAEGDAFEQGPTLVFSVGGLVRRFSAAP